MGDSDPHIHVESNLNADATVRNVIASTFGIAGSLPSVVTSQRPQRRKSNRWSVSRPGSPLLERLAQRWRRPSLVAAC
ncbi:hypothetical protein [Saccharopolyspora sp. 5N708]|uniref:hypothetical protein n=1 Tax=Saccharopolyspora sp. 5N708 TaxID=3457424 RepID=UPI003FD07E6C